MEKDKENQFDTLALPDKDTRSKNTSFEKLLALKRQNPRISLRHLGKLVGISGEAVRMQFLRHGVDFDSGKPLALEEFKEMRADILAIKQLEGLNSLTPKKLREAGVNHLTMMIEKLHGCEREERGLNSKNSGINVNISFNSYLERMQSAGVTVTIPSQQIEDRLLMERRAAMEAEDDD